MTCALTPVQFGTAFLAAMLIGMVVGYLCAVGLSRRVEIHQNKLRDAAARARKE